MFGKWCLLKGIRPLPVTPDIVAAFIVDCTELGADTVWKAVKEISVDHLTGGFADPTAGGPAAHLMNTLSKIAAPRSWPDEFKFRFFALPYDLQEFFAAHEARREKEIKRAHNEAAKAHKELAAIQQPTKVTDGTSQNAAS